MKKPKLNTSDPFAEPSDIFDTPASSVLVDNRPRQLGKPVKNVFPRTTAFDYRIAIIGEAPGRDEELQGEPFVGASGRFLNALLAKANIQRSALFVGNICQYRPPNDDISFFSRQGVEITSGLEQLKTDLALFEPNICVLLGKTALWAAKGVDDIGNWRGSVFISDVSGPFLGRKCIASYHPAACLRQYEWTPLLVFDLKKALKHAFNPRLDERHRDLLWNLSYEELISELDSIIRNKTPVSPDIEGGLSSLSCCSFATSATRSILVPFTKLDGSSYWETDEQEYQIWDRFVRILSDVRIPKCWQNGLYDRFILQYGYNIVVRGNVDDTMLKFWEQWCELEKGLASQCSILTDECYYKFERKSADYQTQAIYCCKDSANTYEINSKLEKILARNNPRGLEHYRFNNALLNPILYMELRGIRYDTTSANQRRIDVLNHIYDLQADLDQIAGCSCPTDRNLLRDLVANKLCYKRDQTKPKKDHVEDYKWAMHTLSQPNELSKIQLSRLNVILGRSMNIKSAAFKTFLYETLKLPKQYHPVTGALSTNYEALLKIQRKQKHQAVQLAIEIGELRTRAQMLAISADPDGRVRCGYNVVGTETGRLTCYTSPTGSGYNLQTIPAENQQKPKDHPLRGGLRDLFIADEGSYLFQCDLSGADGWTVGARLASLGDPTMLDDLRARLKPAAIICYMLRHGHDSLRGKTREEIRDLLKEISKDSWDYFACKQGIWGTCYTMGPRKLAEVIHIQSEGKVYMSESETRDFQRAVFARYNVRLWHDAVARYIRNCKGTPTLTSPSGHTRKFFGRPDDILAQMLAHEPQSVTTYATNLAVYKLWTDPENRLYKGEHCTLRIEPLHQVHDALIGQFRIDDTSWAVDKIKSYFNNPINIAGQTIVIPFEGAYGTNWALDDKSKVGSI